MDYATSFDALIFDCDGTLSDSMPVHYVAWRATLSKYRLSFPESLFYEMAGMPTDKIIQRLSADQGVEVDVNRVAGHKEMAFMSMLEQVRPLEPICEIARRCHGTVPMAVASGSDRPVVLRQLKAIEMESLFKVVVTAEDTSRHKPEPDVFLEAARQLNVAPERCAVFEDAELGMQAAQKAGMHAIHIREILQS